MIVNTGGRTDTVQYFTEWLLRRFSEGYVLTRNPMFPHRVSRYELTPETVDCVVFCSKNYRPILPRLSEITDRFPTYFHYTITAYGKDVEPGVPSIEESMETLMALSRQVGRQRVSWRYDPVLLTREYTVGRHLETFARMAAVLAPHIDRCIFSFVELYRKLETNMPELRPISAHDRDTLALEYFRDVKAGKKIGVPKNYFPHDNPAQTPIVKWRSAAQLMYTNWLNYYVYQTTPYDLGGIK